jgi:hypothetical protein
MASRKLRYGGIEAKIIAIKHETDGDYHLVLQGQSGQEMVCEIPTPTTVFVLGEFLSPMCNADGATFLPICTISTRATLLTMRTACGFSHACTV